MKEKKIAGLITAGGSSSRMKDGINKLFIPINGNLLNFGYYSKV